MTVKIPYDKPDTLENHFGRRESSHRIHEFYHSGAAYDATQSDEQIRNGDILLIVEGDDYRPDALTIVGLADTWPVAVTKTKGHLHQYKDDRIANPDDALSPKWTSEQIHNAVALAHGLGCEIHSAFIGFRPIT